MADSVVEAHFKIYSISYIQVIINHTYWTFKWVSPNRSQPHPWYIWRIKCPLVREMGSRLTPYHRPRFTWWPRGACFPSIPLKNHKPQLEKHAGMQLVVIIHWLSLQSTKCQKKITISQSPMSPCCWFCLTKSQNSDIFHLQWHNAEKSSKSAAKLVPALINDLKEFTGYLNLLLTYCLNSNHVLHQQRAI